MLFQPYLLQHLGRAFRQLARAAADEDLAACPEQLGHFVPLRPDPFVRVSVAGGGGAIGPAFGETGPRGHGALLFPRRDLVAVDVVFLVVAAAEVEQCRPELDGACAGDGGALLDEASHGRDAGAGGDHDDGHCWIGWEVERGVCRADKAVETAARAKGCEVGSGDAVECSGAAGARGRRVHVVCDCRGEHVLGEVMALVQSGRRDGVLPRGQGFEHVDVRGQGKFDGAVIL